MSDLAAFEHDGELVIDSRLVAKKLGVQHKNFLETIDTYKTRIEEAFGKLRFETRELLAENNRRYPERYALLTEDQAIFLITLSRNTPEVVDCKIGIVKAFSKARELLKQRQPRPEYIPYWYQRMKIALSDSEKPLQRGYFCAYQEIMDFFAQLETRLGYLIADFDPKTGRYLVPDGSIGLGFNKFLRSEDEFPVEARKHFLGSVKLIDFRQPGPRKEGWFSGGKDYHEIQMYNHIYPKVSHGDYQRQEANSYPEKYLLIFRYYLDQYWIPDICLPYLLERDPQGIQTIKQRLLGMDETERAAISKTAISPFVASILTLPESI